MRWDELDQENCSLARTLSVVGDRWTLLILRDCFLRVRRFEQFQQRLGITRHLLADRLARLAAAGVLTKHRYTDRPPRFEYRLTEKGLDLYPVIMALVHWGDAHMAGPEGRPVLHRHVACGKQFDPVLACSCCGQPVTAREVRVEPGLGARQMAPSIAAFRSLPPAASHKDRISRRKGPSF